MPDADTAAPTQATETGNHHRNRNFQRQRRHHRMGGQGLTSVCNGMIIRGTVEQLIAKHEQLGGEADRAKDHIGAQLHFQHADHYRRVLSGEA